MHRFVFFISVIAVLSLPAVLLNAADIEDGLWLYLPMNEGAGNKVTDHGPHNFDTELSKSPPKWVDAKHDESGPNNIGPALEFDGTSNYVKIDMASQGKDIDSHFDTDKGLTICAWIKVLNVATDAHGQTRQPVVMKGGPNQWEFALYIYDNFGAGMSVWTCPGSGVSEPSTPDSVPESQWIHHCGTFKLTEGVKVYINGEEDPVAQAGDNSNGPCEAGDRPVFIAHREDGQWLNAIIAEVYMWERVIDIDEIYLAMNTIGGLTTVQPGGKLTTTWGKVKQHR